MSKQTKPGCVLIFLHAAYYIRKLEVRSEMGVKVNQDSYHVLMESLGDIFRYLVLAKTGAANAEFFSDAFLDRDQDACRSDFWDGDDSYHDDLSGSDTEDNDDFDSDDFDNDYDGVGDGDYDDDDDDDR